MPPDPTSPLPATSLLGTVRALVGDDEARAAWREDPQGFLAARGLDGIDADDLATAWPYLADGLPAPVALAFRDLPADGGVLERLSGVVELDRLSAEQAWIEITGGELAAHDTGGDHAARDTAGDEQDLDGADEPRDEPEPDGDDPGDHAHRADPGDDAGQGDGETDAPGPPDALISGADLPPEPDSLDRPESVDRSDPTGADELAREPDLDDLLAPAATDAAVGEAPADAAELDLGFGAGAGAEPEAPVLDPTVAAATTVDDDLAAEPGSLLERLAPEVDLDASLGSELDPGALDLPDESIAPADAPEPDPDEPPEG